MKSTFLSTPFNLSYELIGRCLDDLRKITKTLRIASVGSRIQLVTYLPTEYTRYGSQLHLLLTSYMFRPQWQCSDNFLTFNGGTQYFTPVLSILKVCFCVD